MKKRGFLVCLLITSIFVCMVEPSSAIYTWSKTFSFNLVLGEVPPDYPLSKGTYLHYEIVDQVPGSTVEENLNHEEIEIRGEAGAFRTYETSYLTNLGSDFHVRARVTKLAPAELRNLGVTFMGSFANYTGNDGYYDSIGNVLKFNADGDLYIETQKVHHANHKDYYGEVEASKVDTHLLLKKAEFDERFPHIRFDRSIYFDIFVQKTNLFDSASSVSIYINNTLLNAEPIKLKSNTLINFPDASKKNIMIGVSSYQMKDEQGNFILHPLRSVFVNDLFFMKWDGNLPK